MTYPNTKPEAEHVIINLKRDRAPRDQMTFLENAINRSKTMSDEVHAVYLARIVELTDEIE